MIKSNIRGLQRARSGAAQFIPQPARDFLLRKSADQSSCSFVGDAGPVSAGRPCDSPPAPRPGWCRKVRPGAAPGIPSPRLAAVLDHLADRGERHPAQVWRITASSVRRALDAEHGPQEILHRLQAVSTTGELPQPVTDLVEQAAARHLDTPALRCLAYPIDHRLGVTIAYKECERSAEHILRGLELDPPCLHAYAGADDMHSFHLGRIHDVGAAPVHHPVHGSAR